MTRAYLRYIAAGMFVLSWFGWLRLWQAVASWKLLLSLETSVSPVYLVISGAVWGVLGLGVGFLLWFCLGGYRQVILISRISGVFFALSYWGERLFLTRSPTSQANWLFALGLTLLALGLLFFYSELLIRYERTRN